MVRVLARFAAIALSLVAIITVTTASNAFWHNPVPEELLKKKS